MILLIVYCCAIEKILLTSQYSTSPDGKVMKKIVKITGKYLNTFSCMGSVKLVGVMCRCTNMDAPMSMGSTN